MQSGSFPVGFITRAVKLNKRLHHMAITFGTIHLVIASYVGLSKTKLKELNFMKDIKLLLFGLIFSIFILGGILAILPVDMLQKTKDIAMVIGILVALFTYVTNSIIHRHKTVTETLPRIIDAVNRVVTTDLWRDYANQFDNGTFVRDHNDEVMNGKFFAFYATVDQLALIHNSKLIPSCFDTYIFGWICQQVQPHILPSERNDIYWTLAITFRLYMGSGVFLIKPSSRADNKRLPRRLAL